MNLIRDRWMLVPILLLGVSVTLAAVTVTFAIARQPLGVEPDYYEKSLRWDDDRAQSGTNDRLGWSVSPEIAGGQNGLARLAITVKDKHGVLIPVDAVEVEAIPIRNADLRTRVALSRESEGRFAADVPLRFSGQWEFRVRASRGSETYTDHFRRSLAFAPLGGTS